MTNTDIIAAQFRASSNADVTGDPFPKPTITMATKRNPYLYCHECKDWVDVEMNDHDEFTCKECGETILCDECGQPWTDDHACDGDDEEALRLDREENLRRQDQEDRPASNWFYAKDSGRDLNRGAV